MKGDVHLTITDESGLTREYSIFYLNDDICVMFRVEPRGEEE
tara:strand:+ start:6279 stop:6404 length:126 start_codon:yes stop_codon:yes gene_type:complete